MITLIMCDLSRIVCSNKAITTSITHIVISVAAMLSPFKSFASFVFISIPGFLLLPCVSFFWHVVCVRDHGWIADDQL